MAYLVRKRRNLDYFGRMGRWYFLFFLVSLSNYGQKTTGYTVKTIAFYNAENLFDTANDTLIFDDERTPEGAFMWSEERYRKKIEHISRVLSEIGWQITKTSPDIIGLCEVENRKVVHDLANHHNLIEKNYGIIHSDSPDERGIDVALLYKKSSFLPISHKSVRLLLFDEEGFRDYTRDQLVVLFATKILGRGTMIDRMLLGL